MKLELMTYGDSSVGIQPQAIVIDFMNWNLDDDARKQAMELATTFVQDLTDEPVAYATFDDECGDCRGRDGKHAEGCPTNWPEQNDEPIAMYDVTKSVS